MSSVRNRMAIVTMLVTAASIAGETTAIQPATLQKRIANKDSSLIVLDVRTPEEFTAGRVPGAINIPYTHLPVRASEVSADKDIVIYCATGIRAEHAATRFRESGFTRLLHLEGDMTGWVDGGDR